MDHNTKGYFFKVRRIKMSYRAEDILTKSQYDRLKAECKDENHNVGCYTFVEFDGDQKSTFNKAAEIFRPMVKEWLRRVYHYNGSELLPDNVAELFSFEFSYVDVSKHELYYSTPCFGGSNCEHEIILKKGKNK